MNELFEQCNCDYVSWIQKDDSVRQEETNPNRMKIHWMNMAKDPRRIQPMLLNFTTALGQKLRAIEKFPKDRTESHTTESARMNHKSGEEME